MDRDEEMGQLIDMRAHFAKKQQMVTVLPKIGEIFLKSFPVKIPNKDLFGAFIQSLLAEPSLPTLDLMDDQIICLDYQLQTMARPGQISMSSSLYYARMHMERSLKLGYQNLSAVKRFVKLDPANGDRIARNACGMFSIAWQIMDNQTLVTDAESMAKCHAKKRAPK
jgi:hypothetical protein